MPDTSNSRWIIFARASFYEFLGRLYHAIYVGEPTIVRLHMGDSLLRPEIDREIADEQNRLLYEYGITDKYKTTMDLAWGVLLVEVPGSEEKEKHYDK